MAKRVGIVLSGCGAEDGSEIHEAVLVLLAVERAGGEGICFAPDLPLPRVVDHRTKQPAAGEASRSVAAEAARIARGKVRDLAAAGVEDLDALVFPGGWGVATTLSNYAEKAAVCDVHPDVVRLL